jgi:predicted house-cleaning noncanonical NTP pyrophosphatase (MazG superfamily)
MSYPKLVRDKIPDIIRAEGRTPEVRTADANEYWTRLREKLREEVAEFLESEDTTELADILEVIDAIALVKGIDPTKLRELKTKKSSTRGGFAGRVILVDPGAT